MNTSKNTIRATKNSIRATDSTAKKSRGFDNLTDAELAHGIELMISPDDLKSRSLMIAILKAAEFSPREVKEQIQQNEVLFDGPAVRWAF